jgi:tetratricopeptide (TPR) repeat protein
MTRRSHSVADEQLSDAPLPGVRPEQIPAVAYDYIVKGDLQTAKRYLRSGDIRGSEEDYWAVWSELGNAYWERGHFVEAGRAYQTACDMFPERLISQFNMGTARLMASDFTGAMECFKNADRIQPKDPKVLCNIAATHFLQHEYDQAEEVLFKTISIRPEYVRALNTLAGVLGASKRLDKAIEVCDRVLLINPNHAEAAFKKGVIHLTKNEATEAVAPLELAMSSADLKFEAQCFMARTLSFLNKCEQAESFMSETSAAVGASDHVLISEAWKAIGIGWTATNEIIRSVEAFRKAADVSPKDPEICLDLGLAYSRTTQGETEAVKWFQAFLRLKSEHSRKATVTSFPSETGAGKPLRTTKT